MLGFFSYFCSLKWTRCYTSSEGVAGTDKTIESANEEIPEIIDMKKTHIIAAFSLLLLVTCYGCKHTESVDERIARQEREEQSKETMKELYRNQIDASYAAIDSLEKGHRNGTISERDYQLNTAIQKKVIEELESRYNSVD